MIHRTQQLDAIEKRYARERIGNLTYQEALALFAALWREARALNPDFPTSDWRRDIASDIELARALNGLSAGA